MRLRTKIALGITGLVVSILSFVAVLSYYLISSELRRGVDDALRLSANQLVAMAEVEDGRLHLEQTDDGHMLAPLGDEDLLRLVASDGSVIDSRGLKGVPVDKGLFSNELTCESTKADISGETTEIRVATMPVFGENSSLLAYLQVGKSLSTVHQTERSLKRFFSILLPICFAFAGGVSYFLAARALAPMEKIRLQAEKASAERLEEGLGLDRLPDDEVGRLARTFDEMLRRLGSSFFRQRRFTADASHELRTPVSIIRGAAEVALSRSRTQEEYVGVLETILRESEFMTRLINDLLFLARSDSTQLQLSPEKVDLKDLLLALGEDYSEGSGQLLLQMECPLHVSVDRDRIIQVVFNLLENCRVHAPDSDVRISGGIVDRRVRVVVSDQGPGIEEHHLAHLTERFYRVDSARTRQSSSSGLGLSIAHEIMEAHGGSLRVESEIGAGTNVILELPMTED
ncbi:MAG: HAMP domain-containing protein [Candidatus Eremiobacteraeota bacterium]|nr:HAMP domain-containing protein [Candidatus Eremiobacteraeota bacterium]